MLKEAAWAVLGLAALCPVSCFQLVAGGSLRASSPRASRATVVMAAAHEHQPSVSRRAVTILAGLCLRPAGATADDKPLVPDAERIKPPETSCAQGVGGKCAELAEGNTLILELQKRSAQNREKYQKQELESYWNRNYKDFFDASCNVRSSQCAFTQTGDGTWEVGQKKGAFGLKTFKERQAEMAKDTAAFKGSGIPAVFKKDAAANAE